MSLSKSDTCTIHVHKYNVPFTTLPNAIWESHNISWAAKGLLGYLLSRPENWQIHTWQLIEIYEGKKKGGGQFAIKILMKELREAGYITYSKSKDPKGHWVHRYDVYPEPVEKEIKEKIPEVDYPPMDYPPMENHPILTNTELTNIELEISSKEDISMCINARAREKKHDERKSYGKFVKMKEDDYTKFVKEYGINKVKEIFESIDDHCTNNRKGGYTDYAAAFRTFIKKGKKGPTPSAFPSKRAAIDKGAINQRPDHLPTGWHSS